MPVFVHIELEFVSLDECRQGAELLLCSVKQREADREVHFGMGQPARVDRTLKPGTDNLIEDLECLTQRHLASTGKESFGFPLVRRSWVRATGVAASCARPKGRDFRWWGNRELMRVVDEGLALKLAMNESVARNSNERLSRMAISHRFESSQGVPFVCECADAGCHEIVMLSLEDYERVRAQSCWFLLVAGHEDAEATHERIVEAENGYAIVEKLGVAGREAARLDPRHSSRLR